MPDVPRRKLSQGELSLNARLAQWEASRTAKLKHPQRTGGTMVIKPPVSLYGAIRSDWSKEND